MMKRLVLASLLALSACGAPPKAAVEDVVVNLPLAPGRPGVAYFTLKGGPADARLIKASSPQVIRIELHDSVMEGGVMKMKPLEGGAEVPAGGSVEFKPGGKHAMLYDIKPELKVGDKISFTFGYADGSSLTADGEIKARGDAAGHDH